MRRLASLAAASLLAACSSQIVMLPPAPDGTSTRVDVAWEKGQRSLDNPDYAFYSDPHFGVTYRISDEDLRRDFDPSLETMRAVLAAGLPELPHSYMVLLPHPRGPLGSLEFVAGDGQTRPPLTAATEAVYIDGYPGRPEGLDAARLHRDFGAALAALRETLKIQRSYLMLLESPDGESSQVVFRSRAAESVLGRPGECLTLDGLGYEPDEAVVTRDFSDSRSATRQILDAGLPALPHSYAALLDSPLGAVGEVEILDGPARGVVLRQAGQAVIIDGYSEKIYTLDDAQLRRDFGAATEALPPPPVTLIVYFDSGSARLNRDARAVLPAVLAEIRKRPAADVSIAGHTDTVSGDTINERLSRQRGEAIAAYLRQSGAPVTAISLEAYGETLLAVNTADNRAEELNRRVEVTVR